MKLVSFTLAIYEKLRQKGCNSLVLKSTVKGMDREYCNDRPLRVFQAYDSKSASSTKNVASIGLEKVKDMMFSEKGDYYIVLTSDI